MALAPGEGEIGGRFATVSAGAAPGAPPRGTLRASGSRVAEAARRLGMGRATLYKKIAARGIAL